MEIIITLDNIGVLWNASNHQTISYSVIVLNNLLTWVTWTVLGRLSGREVLNSEKIWVARPEVSHEFPAPHTEPLSLVTPTEGTHGTDQCQDLLLTATQTQGPCHSLLPWRQIDDAPFHHHSITGWPPKACSSEPWPSSPFSPYSRRPWLLLSLEFAVLDDFKPRDKRIHRPFPSHRLSQVWGSEFKPRIF